MTYSEAHGVTEVDRKQSEKNNNDLWNPINSTKGLWAFNPNFVKLHKKWWSMVSCYDMCKIVNWLDHYNKDPSKSNFHKISIIDSSNFNNISLVNIFLQGERLPVALGIQ